MFIKEFSNSEKHASNWFLPIDILSSSNSDVNFALSWQVEKNTILKQ